MAISYLVNKLKYIPFVNYRLIKDPNRLQSWIVQSDHIVGTSLKIRSFVRLKPNNGFIAVGPKYPFFLFKIGFNDL